MKELSKAEKQRMINNVLDSFDFVKVQKAMKAVNWTWATCNGVPSIRALMAKAEDLLWQVLNNDEMQNISTGGLTAELYDDVLSLTFTFEETEAYVDNY